MMINVVFLVFQGKSGAAIHHFTYKSFLLILMIVGAAYTAQLTITRAVYLKSASEVGLFSYSLIVVSLIIDIVVFN